MPYIPKSQRKGYPTGTSGQLTYSIYKLCIKFMNSHFNNFDTRALVLGSLDAASKEFYRQWCEEYEDAKLKENGDVSSK
jgi:hypothetical protein